MLLIFLISICLNILDECCPVNCLLGACEMWIQSMGYGFVGPLGGGSAYSSCFTMNTHLAVSSRIVKDMNESKCTIFVSLHNFILRNSFQNHLRSFLL
jgi:hypothetical protein